MRAERSRLECRPAPPAGLGEGTIARPAHVRASAWRVVACRPQAEAKEQSRAPPVSNAEGLFLFPPRPRAAAAPPKSVTVTVGRVLDDDSTVALPLVEVTCAAPDEGGAVAIACGVETCDCL